MGKGHPLLLWAAFAIVVLTHGADNYDSLAHASVEGMVSKQEADEGREDVENMFREFFATQDGANTATPALELIDAFTSQPSLKAASAGTDAVLVKLPPGMQLPPGAMRVQQVNQAQSHPVPQVQQLATQARAQAKPQVNKQVPVPAASVHPVTKQPVQAVAQPTPLQVQKVQVQTQVAAPKVTTQPVQGKAPVQVQPQAKNVVVVVKKQTPAQVKKQAKKKAKKKLKKKLHLARQFNKLVKNVDSILDEAMKKLKNDKKLFHKAVKDGHKKQIVLQHEAKGARRHAKGDSVKMDAIQTHMALAQRAGARAFIKFVNTFRTGAKKNFRADYKNAKIHERQLKKIYHKICHHVSHAWKAMKAHGKKLHAVYMTELKHYWKAKYSCGGDKKPAIKAALKKARHAAKLKMKHARGVSWHFKQSMHKAHHHAKKLRKGLQQALRKIHFVFKKARSMYRHTAKTFQVGFAMQVAAQQPVSQKALRRLRKRRQQRKQTNLKHTKKRVQHRPRHAHKLAHKKLSHRKPSAHVKHVSRASASAAPKKRALKHKLAKHGHRGRLDTAEKKAVKIVKRAILQQQRARLQHVSRSTPVKKQRQQVVKQDLAEEDEDEYDELWQPSK